MTKQEELYNEIKNNNVNKVKCLLKNPEVDLLKPNSIIYFLFIQHNMENSYYKMIELLLKDKRIDPSGENNWAISYASSLGQYELVKLLLEDKRVSPTAEENYAIKSAYSSRSYNIVELLWKDKRVKNTLKNDFLELYNKLIPEDIKNKVDKF